MKVKKIINICFVFYFFVSNLNVLGMELEEFNFCNFVEHQNDELCSIEHNFKNLNSNNIKNTYKCGYIEKLKEYQGANNKIILYHGYDNVYKWTDESREAMFYLLKNLPHDIKWKMSVDGKFHSMNNCLIFDEDRKGYEGEKGWHDSMISTWDFIADNIDSKTKINAEFYDRIHDKAVQYIYKFEDNPNKILGFLWNSKFGVDGTLNGLIEFFIKSNQTNRFSQNSDVGLLLENSKVVKDKNSWPHVFKKFYIKDLDAYHVLHLKKRSNNSENRNLQKAFDEYDSEIKKINNSCIWEFGFSYNEYIEGFRKLKEYFRKNFDQLHTSLIPIRFDSEEMEIDNEKLYSDGKIKKSFLDNLSFEYPYIKNSRYVPLINQFNKSKCSKNQAIIGAIIRLTQDLDQAHPFRDGNIRSAYSLLQLLLIRNNLVPSIMCDPNDLDFHDIYTLLEVIKTGQKNFVDLLISNKEMIFKKLGIEIQTI